MECGESNRHWEKMQVVDEREWPGRVLSLVDLKQKAICENDLFNYLEQTLQFCHPMTGVLCDITSKTLDEKHNENCNTVALLLFVGILQ